mmetsp:Transcript_1951/g.3154  ORF Transcript_1951/g.3154 Transcript_1951/m.3154 type:complete len:131 (-) Transcript_1951:17-409(-)
MLYMANLSKKNSWGRLTALRFGCKRVSLSPQFVSDASAQQTMQFPGTLNPPTSRSNIKGESKRHRIGPPSVPCKCCNSPTCNNYGMQEQHRNIQESIEDTSRNMQSNKPKQPTNAIANTEEFNGVALAIK